MNSSGSLEKGFQENQRHNAPPDCAGCSVPARLPTDTPDAVLWVPGMANSDLVLAVPAPWWTYIVWHTPEPGRWFS